MSLINKMLQDLDARGTAPGEALPSQIKPVAREPHGVNKRVLAAGVAGGVAAVAVAWFGWQQLHAPGVASAPVVAKPAPAAVPVPVPAAAKAPPQMTSTITMLPAGAPAPESAPAAELPAAPAPEPAPVVAERAAASEPPVPVKAEARPAKPEAPQARREGAVPRQKAAADTAPVRLAYQSVAPVEPDSEQARTVRRALVQELEARQARKPFAPAKAVADSRNAPGRNQSVSQRAEADYRRALASMQDGRMGETIASLESALRIDPGHEPARQTLVGLLIEAKRPDDAIRQLQLGLTQDPRQPALAMLLARLQIERGGNGIETLTRTLPYAGANPDYHAFLAGALQRQQRHREAAAEYQAALRSVPGNGVWWMGMGISLQAEKRNSEALEAFQKALGSGVLSAELQAFVERQIRQLGR
ncbi:tetratricopeptide repeat protein [Massilia phyllosphaerae]|uniref:tetratricopeptide repeat protein n=1 Tax=Massilia phyllosphaerae TaxID=3106034 RepID=UPI002B1CC19A|nr:tetratricopeptide repeat protein [Massilia sp. SGZ-792]